MKKNNKKGFTIVELVIVIAVIAILAAVLIPTFSSIIKKAKVNNDIQLVRNLNTALATDTKEHKTMQSALDAAFEFGYDVAKINNTSVDENEILWDSKNDVFCYLKDGTLEYVPNSVADGDKLPADSYLLWTISNTVDPTYSTYLYKYEVTETTKKVIALKGLDVGKTEGITEIEYVNNTAQEVVIRTNGGTLKINAPSGIVKHYGDALGVNIIEIAKESYHEHGTVLGNIEIAKGRIEVANGAKVGTILVSSAATGHVRVDVVSGAEIGTVAPTTENAKQDINASSTIPTGSKQEEIVDKTAISKFAGGLGTEASPYLIANATQFKNIGSFDYQTERYFFNIVNDFTVDYVKDLQSSVVSSYFNGVIDGLNHNIYLRGFGISDNVLYHYSSGVSEIKNIDFHVLDENAPTLIYGWDSGKTIFENVNFGNSDDRKTISTGSNGGLYINFVLNYAKFINCKNYYSLNYTEEADYFGVFIGGYMDEDADVTFDSCINYGNVTAPYAGLFFGNPQGCRANNTHIINCKNEGNVMGLIASFAIGSINEGYDHNLSLSGLTGVNKIYAIEANGLSISENEAKKLVITKTNNPGAEKYVVSFTVWAGAYYEDGTKYGTRRITISFDFKASDFNENQLVTDLVKFKIYDKETYETNYQSGETQNWIKNGDLSYFVDYSNGIIVVDYNNIVDILGNKLSIKTDDKAKINIFAYNSDNLPVAGYALKDC